MKFKKEWSEYEMDQVLSVFKKWERNNLVITHGQRCWSVEDTYGLPYTSSGCFAMVSNTNVEAVLREYQIFKFDWLGITENSMVVAGFTDDDENEKVIIIGHV